MSLVFGDSDYWIALLHPNDQLHHKATDCSKRLGRKRVITSEMVMTEVLNYFSNQGPPLREAAAAWAKNLPDQPRVTVVPQSDAQFHQAVEFYRQRLDK